MSETREVMPIDRVVLAAAFERAADKIGEGLAVWAYQHPSPSVIASIVAVAFQEVASELRADNQRVTFTGFPGSAFKSLPSGEP